MEKGEVQEVNSREFFASRGRHGKARVLCGEVE
jgi:hypothetical protein